MSLQTLAFRSLVFYRRTHAAVALGVAGAVAVMAGALLVGGSVRASLAAMAASRLGRAVVIVTAERPFGEGLGERILSRGSARGKQGPSKVSVPENQGQTPRAPLLALAGGARHELSGRRARDVQIYGVDRRFFAFHGVAAEPPSGSEVLLSPDLAAELGAAPGDTVLVRVTRPTGIPLDSLQGRKDDAARVVRLRYRGLLGRESMGEFSLTPKQGPIRAAFVALSLLQHDLEQAGRVNTVLVAAPLGMSPSAEVRADLPSVLEADDYGLRFFVDESAATIVVEATAGLLPDAVATAVETAAAGESLEATPVLTWLANRMTVRDRSVPYSLVTALDPVAGHLLLNASGAPPPLARPPAFEDSLSSRGPQTLPQGPSPKPSIVLNDWTARDLRAAPGDPLELEYYRWTDDGRLITERESFQIAAVVPMQGFAIDRHLAPDYPGITTSDSLADWNPPFPINLSLVRPIDEDYWRRFRTTPKAFVPLAVGQRLWRTRHGQVTSVRIRPTVPGVDLRDTARGLRAAVARAIDPFQAGFNVVDVRAQSAAASEGATDFSVYFASFSLFLVLSSFLLTALFFRLGIEQRLPQIGVLRAAGFSLAEVRRLFLFEGLWVSLVGCGLGVLLAIGWAALMMHGLSTWWVDAVGTARLDLHVDPIALAAGAVSGLLAGAISITIAIRGLGRVSPRELLTGARDVALSGAAVRSGWVAAGSLAAAAILTGSSMAGWVPAAGGFFGAGTLVLIGALAGFRRWLGRGVGTPSALFRLGVRNASWRPGRSLASAGLVAAAAFLIVSIDAFRKDPQAAGSAPSGTGGFGLIAESTAPIVRDPSTPEGREALGLSLGPDVQDLRGVDLVALRLRPGDDTSCLNLYQPKRPRILGVPDRFIDAARFRFSGSVASTEPDRRNPWRLLRVPIDDGIVPAIADATSLEYVLHASVGDVIGIDTDTVRPLRLRIVAALSDSVLQGEIVIAERAFLTVFPETVGYHVLLIDLRGSSRDRRDRVARVLEERLEPFGVDVQDSDGRLAAYHRVENTYLSTFQALGGLGLLLGSFGVAAVIARNVLERRRELALLGATGYTGRDLQVVVFSEQLTLVVAGLTVGVVAAFVAIAPVFVTRANGLPRLSFAWLAIVAATALGSALWTTRAVRRLRLVESLRSE